MHHLWSREITITTIIINIYLAQNDDDDDHDHCYKSSSLSLRYQTGWQSPSLHNILLPSPSHLSLTRWVGWRWGYQRKNSFDVQCNVLVQKPYARGWGLTNVHHSLIFSSRWTNQRQKNERVWVFGSIWLRCSRSHIRQAVCGGWCQAYGSQPHRFGWMRPIPATILPGTKPTPSNPLPLHPTGR